MYLLATALQGIHLLLLIQLIRAEKEVQPPLPFSSSLSLQSHLTLQSCGPGSDSAWPENRRDTGDLGIDTCGWSPSFAWTPQWFSQESWSTPEHQGSSQSFCQKGTLCEDDPSVLLSHEVPRALWEAAESIKERRLLLLTVFDTSSFSSHLSFTNTFLPLPCLFKTSVLTDVMKGNEIRPLTATVQPFPQPLTNFSSIILSVAPS